jgi:hypothetical protein
MGNFCRKRLAYVLYLTVVFFQAGATLGRVPGKAVEVIFYSGFVDMVKQKLPYLLLLIAVYFILPGYYGKELQYGIKNNFAHGLQFSC